MVTQYVSHKLGWAMSSLNACGQGAGQGGRERGAKRLWQPRQLLQLPTTAAGSASRPAGRPGGGTHVEQFEGSVEDAGVEDEVVVREHHRPVAGAQLAPLCSSTGRVRCRQQSEGFQPLIPWRVLLACRHSMCSLKRHRST